MAKTKANKETVLIVAPKAAIPANAPIKETGIAHKGIAVARKEPRKK